MKSLLLGLVLVLGMAGTAEARRPLHIYGWGGYRAFGGYGAYIAPTPRYYGRRTYRVRTYQPYRSRAYYQSHGLYNYRG